MRLKKASLAFAGAASAVAITTMAASPAWACNNRDPKLQLAAHCGKLGPDWTLINPNNFAVPATWMDNKGGKSEHKINVPARSSIPLPTHATLVKVLAYRIDRPNLPVWENHGAIGKLLKCLPKPPAKPSPKPSKPAKPAPKPSASSPASAPSGEAKPAKPVDKQPEFTG
jgi:hypothetical protein